jgi:septal ring factor EnvC (AmiA/AmiB activator)
MRGLKLFLILTVTLGLAFAAAASDKRSSRQDFIRKSKKLEDVKKQIREEEKSVRTISEKETDILGDLETINKDLAAKREELDRTQRQLAGVQKKVNAANANIERLEKDRDLLSDRLKSRLKAMYKMRRGEYLSLLFSSESPRDLGRRHKYLTIIMDSDSNLISGYEKTLSSLEDEKNRLTALSSELGSVKSSALAAKNETLKLQRRKTAFLSGIKKEKERRVKVLGELEEAAAELKDLLNQLRAEEEKKEEKKEEAGEAPFTGTGFGAMRGKLNMPVKGTVVSSYGRVKHPRFQTVTFNNGIMIEAPADTPVKSVYDGKVVYVGWLKGYGQVLIMDNGGGYYTLFANLSKVLKEKGETAEKGTDVGLVGDTGTSAATGLYFEIRHKGVPRDPMGWFAAR